MIYEGLLLMVTSCCIYKFFKHSETSKEILMDELTGMYNRKVMERIKSLDKRNKYIVVAYDIDHFKYVNDTYGHATGDVALISVSNIIKNTFTEDGEFNVRFGGEEFFSFVVEDSENGKIVLEKAESVRHSIENSKVVVDGKLIKLTISIGISFVSEEEDIRLRIEKADKLLYKSKSDGRNRITHERK